MNFPKPNIIARLFKGETIYQRLGFVDTWNWIVSCWNNIKAGRGIMIDDVGTGEPMISLNIEAGDNITIENGCSDNSIRISSTGGGGECVINVITGLQFTMTDTTTPTPKLICNVSTTPILVTPCGDVPCIEAKTALQFKKQVVVVDAEYNTDGTHRFVNKTKSSYMVRPDMDETDVEVFTTMEHECPTD